MPDDFNQDLSANVDSEVFGEDQQKTNPLDAIKPYTGIIIKVGILLVILVIAYWFFFMRYTTVSFDVIASGSSKPTTITLSGDGDPITIDTLTETKLLPGEYNITIDDPDLDDFYLLYDTISITKEDDDSTLDIKLYPNWVKDIDKKEFKIIEQPKNVYSGQNIEMKINVTNKGKPVSVTLKSKGDANVIENFELITGKNTLPISFANTKKVGETIKTTFYLDGADDILKITDFNAKVKKAPSVKLNAKAMYQANAGSNSKMTFELVNSSQEKIEDLNFSIASSNWNSDILLEWIPNKPTNISISPNSTTTVDVDFNIPLRKVEGESQKINLGILFSNSYLELTKNVELILSPINIILPKQVDLKKMTAGTIKTEKITVENKSNYPIPTKDFTVDASNPSISNPQIMSLDLPETLPIGKLDLALTATIPPTFSTDNIQGTINIITDYDTLSIPFILEIVGINLKLEVNLSDTYTFSYNEMGLSTKDPKKLYIKNSGNIEVNIQYVQPSADCMSFIEISSLVPGPLKVNEQKEFYFVLKENVSKTLLTSPKICNLITTYQDPTSSASVTMQNAFTIQ